MPTFILLKDGEVQETLRGANPPALTKLVEGAAGDVKVNGPKGGAAKKEGDGKEEQTVSGEYTVSAGTDWKTAL